MSDQPLPMIVSKVLGKPATGQVWLEQDAGGHQHLRCTKCGTYEFMSGMAPGLMALRPHADKCGIEGEWVEV